MPSPFSSPGVLSLPPFELVFSTGAPPTVDVELEALLHPALIPVPAQLSHSTESEECNLSGNVSRASSAVSAWWQGPAPHAALGTPPGHGSSSSSSASASAQRGEEGAAAVEEGEEEEEEECLADRLGALWLAASPPHSPSTSTIHEWGAAASAPPSSAGAAAGSLNLSPIPQHPASPQQRHHHLHQRSTPSCSPTLGQARRLTFLAEQPQPFTPPMLLPGAGREVGAAAQPPPPLPYSLCMHPVGRAEFRRWEAAWLGKGQASWVGGQQPLGGSPNASAGGQREHLSPVNAAQDAYAAALLGRLRGGGVS
jgi:hypothetical protein